MNWDRNFSRFELQESNDLDLQRLFSSASLLKKINQKDVISSILSISKQIQFYNYKGETDGNLRRFFASSLPLVLVHIGGDDIKNSIQDLREIGIYIERQRLKGNEISRKLKNDLTKLIALQIENLELLKNAAFSEQKLIEDLIPSFQLISNQYLNFFNTCVANGIISLNRKIKQQFYNILPAPVFNTTNSDNHWTQQLKEFYTAIDVIDINWQLIQKECGKLLEHLIESQSIDPLSSITLILGELLAELSEKNVDIIDKTFENHFFSDIVKIKKLIPEKEILYANFSSIPNFPNKSIPAGTRLRAITEPNSEDSPIDLICSEITPISEQSILKKQIVCFSQQNESNIISDEFILINSLLPTKYELEKLELNTSQNCSPFFFSISSPLLSIDGNVVKWKISSVFNSIDIFNFFQEIFEKSPDIKRSYNDIPMEEMLKNWIQHGFVLCYETIESEISINFDRVYFEVLKNNEQNFEFTWSILLDVDDLSPKMNQNGEIELKFKFIEEYLFLYKFFSKLNPITLNIETSVLDVTNLELYNDFGKLDTTTPFNPFGTRPEIGSKFYIGHPLLFSNALKNLKINWQWFGLPDSTGGFNEHYRNYDLIENNEDFLVTISSLQGGSWFPESDKQVLALFTNAQATAPDQETISNIRRMNEIDISHLNLEKTHRTFELLKEPNKSKYGYLAFELFSPPGAFGHSRYNDLIQRNINSKKSVTILEPYTPLVTGISIEAVMHESIDKNSIKNRIKCYGVEEFIMNQQAVESVSLMPDSKYQSAMYLEFSKFDDGKANLFFSLPERFNGITSDSIKNWYQWNNEHWISIHQDNITRDDTLDFECSGQILIQELLEGEPFINNWLKITSMSDDVLRRVIDVKTQIVKLLIETNKNIESDFDIIGVEVPELLSESISEVIPINNHSIRAIQGVAFKNSSLSFQFKSQNRIGDLQDLKQNLMLKFPKIQEVLVISHKDNFDAIIPGLVRTILIPRAKSDNLDIANWPRFSTLELKQIKLYLEQNSIVGTSYSVENPIYEEIVIKGNIVILPGMDKTESNQLINQSVLKGFLDFTGIQRRGFTFGKSIYTSKLLSIIRSLPFVHSVTNFACYTRFETELVLPENFNSLNYRLEPSNINHILIPSVEHFLDIKESDKSLTDGIGVSNMTLETDFVIDKSRYLQKNLGIGKRKLGINLKINGDIGTDNHAITELFL